MAPKDKHPDLEEFPDRLRKAIVRLRADENLDLPQALDRAGILLEQNSEAFAQELQAKANTLYKSRHMVELNKARSAWKRDADFEAKMKWTEGYQAAQKFVRENATVFRIPCSICGESMTVSSMDGSDLSTIKEVLLEAFKNWSHPSCASPNMK